MRRIHSQLLGVIIPNLYFRAFITGRLIYQGPLKGFCVPTLNCRGCPVSLFACPMGALQHFMAIRQFPFYVIGYLGIVGVLLGRLSCGWICPFGFLQDILYKIKSFKFKIPHAFRYLKYVCLVGVVIILSIITQETWFCKICPQGGLEAGIPLVLISDAMRQLIGVLFIVKMVILGVFLFLFIVCRRPFCTVVCPLGAMYSVFNRVSVIKLTVDKVKCINCWVCAKVCSTGGTPHTNSLDCIKCFECKRKCPNNAIGVKIGLA